MYGGGENSNQQLTFIGGADAPLEQPQTQTQTHTHTHTHTNTVNKINNIIGSKHNTIEAKINSGIKYGEQIAQSNRFLMIFPAFKVLFLVIFLIFFYRRIIDLVTFFDVSDIHADFYITWITFLLILWVILPANRSMVL